MNDELKQKMLEYLQSLESTAQSAAKEIPLVVNEYIQWEMASNLTLACVFLVIFTISFVILCISVRKVFLESSDLTHDQEFAYMLTFIFSLFTSVMFLVGLMITSHNYAKIKYAPRVVILEKISEIVK